MDLKRTYFYGSINYIYKIIMYYNTALILCMTAMVLDVQKSKLFIELEIFLWGYFSMIKQH